MTICCTGFTGQAAQIGKGFGFPQLRVAEYPGHIGTQSADQRLKNYAEVLLPQIVKLLTEPLKAQTLKVTEPALRDIVFSGSFEEVNQFFYSRQWSDGLPIVPPTIEKIEEFLRYTDSSPDEELGVFLPSNRQATVWTVAVNGIMAGCRPEYMPILIAIVKAMADPVYRIQDAGSTPGWEGLILLNGPIRDQLGFHYKEAVLRPGYQANTSIGRFYRLFCRNLPRLLPGAADKSTYGQNFITVLPENDEACRQAGWEPLSVQRGFAPEDNVVTLVSARDMSDAFATTGVSAEEHLDYIVDWVVRVIEPFRVAHMVKEANLLIVSPIVASLLGAQGYSKDAVKRYLHEHASVPAREFELNVKRFFDKPYHLCEEVEKGTLPKEWCESRDPDRRVPLMHPTTDWLVVVSGDPARNRAIVWRQNHVQGWPVSRKVELPANWNSLVKKNLK